MVAVFSCGVGLMDGKKVGSKESVQSLFHKYYNNETERYMLTTLFAWIGLRFVMSIVLVC